MACHEAVTTTATDSPGALEGAGPSSEGFAGYDPPCLLLILKCGAISISIHHSGLQEADDLPKVMLGVSAEAGVKPSGVRR